MQQAAERNRQYKQIDCEHVERKQPDRFVQMPFIDVLYDGDLKLPRQKQKRQHGKNHQPDPAHIAACGSTKWRRQRGQRRPGHCLREDIGGAIKHDEGHVNSDRHERDQFHQ